VFIGITACCSACAIDFDGVVLRSGTTLHDLYAAPIELFDHGLEPGPADHLEAEHRHIAGRLDGDHPERLDEPLSEPPRTVIR